MRVAEISNGLGDAFICFSLAPQEAIGSGLNSYHFDDSAHKAIKLAAYINGADFKLNDAALDVKTSVYE